MIKCEKCDGKAHGLMIMRGTSSFADRPVCCKCLSGEVLLDNRYFDFLDMAKIVDRHRMEKMIPWRGPVEES